MFDKDNGRIIFFEGTYTTTFSGNPDPTPRYDYNQIMYQLDLSDPTSGAPGRDSTRSRPARPGRLAWSRGSRSPIVNRRPPRRSPSSRRIGKGSRRCRSMSTTTRSTVRPCGWQRRDRSAGRCRHSAAVFHSSRPTSRTTRGDGSLVRIPRRSGPSHDFIPSNRRARMRRSRAAVQAAGPRLAKPGALAAVVRPWPDGLPGNLGLTGTNAMSLARVRV